METWIRFIVTNRSFTSLLFLIIVVAAWIKLPDTRVSQNPQIKIPMLVINVILPGASAQEIEQRVISVIEDKLQNTGNLDKFNSYIYNSYASIVIRYDYGVDIDDEYVDINSKINNIKADLPAKTEVTVLKQGPTDLIVSFVLGITSVTATPAELLQGSSMLAQKLRQLKSIEEVKEIHPQEEISIDLDLARIASARLSVGEIESAIKGNNQYLPTGTFTLGDKALSVKAFGSGYTSLEQIRDTMIINREGKALALRDVATVRRQAEKNTSMAQINGNLAVLLTMKLSETANIFDTRVAINEVIEQTKFPESMQVVWLFDAEKGVADKVENLSMNMLQGIIILAVVLLFSVGWRSALIITGMLPAALVLSIIGLSFTEYGVQSVSLAGFIIALGLIVDNGIVVTENAYKLNHYSGYTNQESAIIGTSGVVVPLLSSTLTTALAFAPLYLLTSTTGLFLHSLVAVIWLCLGSSLVAAIIMSSVMLARFGTDNRIPYLPSPPSFLIALMPFRDNVYLAGLRYFIRHPFILVLLVTLLFMITGFAVSKLRVIVFPDSEDPYFTVSIEAPSDRSGEAVKTLTSDIYNEVVQDPAIEVCGSVVADSFPMVDTGIYRVATRRNNAQIFCTVNFRDSHKLDQLISGLNEKLAKYEALADVKAAAFSIGGAANIGDVEVRLSGARIDILRSEAVKLENYLHSLDLEGLGKINNEAQSRYFAANITFKERRANAIGIDRRSVDQVLVLLTHGKEIDKFRSGSGDEFPLVLRAESDSPDPLNVFDRIFVTSRTGSRIPLSQVVSLNFDEDDYDITHDMFKPTISVDISARPGFSVGKLTENVKAALAAYDLPTGISITYEGKIADQAKSFGGLGKYVGVIGLIILAIFVFQFNSLMQPLIICAAIPLSFIGAFLLLYLTGQPLSFLAFIGLTSLMGIVINNSILLVDEGNQLRITNPEMPISEVAITAGRNRFMPILLTSITSIFGLLPLALGDSMFKALAIVVIGGLATSTALTLICLPVIYAFTTRRKAAANIVTSNWSGQSSLGELRDNDV